MHPGDLDAQLEAARSGDGRAIAALYRDINPSLIRYLRHRAPHVAEDLASEVWLAGAQQLNRFVGDAGDFRALLFTIARRRTIDFYRAQSRRVGQVGLSEAGDPADRAETAQCATDNISAERAIARLVRDLPPDQAEAIVLRVVADLSVEQVAAITGHSPANVRVLAHRGLKRLAQVRVQEVVTL
ncbi:MAG: RNA polymerase sigma factor [Acidimicrobiales bacterium]